MKLCLVTDDGDVLDVIDDIAEFDLSKQIARMFVVEEIQKAIETALDDELADRSLNGRGR